MHNKGAFIVGLIGGLLMVSANAIGGIGLWSYLPLIITMLGLPAEIMTYVNLLLSALNWIAGLGGIAVIIGSALFLMNRIRTGKFILGLGAGLELTSIILLFAGYYLAGIMPVTWIPLILNTPGLLGAILAVIATYMAKPAD